MEKKNMWKKKIITGISGSFLLISLISGSAIAQQTSTVTSSTALQSDPDILVVDEEGIRAGAGDHIIDVVVSPIVTGNASSVSFGLISAKNTGKITLGDNLHAIGNTTGTNYIDVISAKNLNSQIEIGDSAVITTTQGNGIFADDEATITIGADSSVRAAGQTYSGVIAKNNGTVNLGAGFEATIVGDNTINPDATPALVSQGILGQLGGAVYAEDVKIVGSGSGVQGVAARDGGSVKLSALADVEVTGNRAIGIVAMSGTYGTTTVDGTDAKISLSGQGTWGVLASGTDAKVALTGKTEVDSNTSGDFYVVGLYGAHSGKVEANEVILNMNGDYNYGISAQVSGSVDVTTAVIHMGGDNSQGISAQASGKAEVDNATITMVGDNSQGISSHGGGSEIVSPFFTSIDLQGINSVGVKAESSGKVTFTDLEIKNQDASNLSLYTTDSGEVAVNGLIDITGDMKADNNGKIDVITTNGSVFTGKADQTGGTINLTFNSGSQWNMTGDWNANLTTASGSSLSFEGTNPMTINASGLVTMNGGTIHFRTDIANQMGDKLVVNQGVHGNGADVFVHNSGNSVVTGNEKITLIEDKVEQGAQFGLVNSVELGGFVYDLDSESDGATGKNWFLRGTKKLSRPATAGVNLIAGSYLLNYSETQTLLQRLGDLGHNKDGNLWARAYGGQHISSNRSFLSGFDMNYSGFQVGADHQKKLKNNLGDLYFGGFLGHTKGNLDYGFGGGNVDAKSVGIYGVYKKESGFYSDLVIKHNWLKNDFHVTDSAGQNVTGKDMKINGFSVSLEVGKRHHFDSQEKQGWYVEPQMQFSMGHQKGDSITASNGLEIEIGSYNSFLGRAGVNVGYELKKGKNPINSYFKLSRVHEFDGDVNYKFNGSKESNSYGDSWWTWGVGMTAQVGNKHNLYFDIERSSGGQFNQPWAVNGGYRFSW